MRMSRRTSRIVVLLIVGTVIGVPGMAAHVARAYPAHAAPQASCAALGTYHVGPRILPLASTGRGHAGAPAPVPGHVGAVVPIAWPYWVLRGRLVISAYSGCGGSTVGSFAVHRTVVGPPMYRPQRRVPALPCAVPCVQPTLGIISAVGRFAQDPLHPYDPSYVTVSATVTIARPGPQLGIPCSSQTGCPGPVVITATQTFTDVTGYLQVPAPVGQMATLSFLPPPVANTGLVPDVMVLQGWRGKVVPTPQPIPGAYAASEHRPSAATSSEQPIAEG